MTTSSDTFVPGAFWTPERARDAVARMQQAIRTPPLSTMFEAGVNEDSHVPPEMLAMAPQLPAPSSTPIDAARVRFRRAHRDDIPRMAQMIAQADLPPLFIDEFLGGFVVADHDGEVVGAGGLEMYDDAGVIRSVVVDPRTRGTGIGRQMSDLMMADARASGATTVYLFTADAHGFWLRLGFEDFALDEWPDAPRQCWQWQFVSRHREQMQGVWPMRLCIDPA